jgi:DNA-binding transcriptional MerR regulator
VADNERSGRGTLTLAELAEVSAVPARTIRYYIARGLFASATGGRAAGYGEEHLEGLSRIRARQEQEQTLAQVAWQLGERPKEQFTPSRAPERGPGLDQERRRPAVAAGRLAISASLIP